MKIPTAMKRRVLLTAVCLMPAVFLSSQQSRDTANIVAMGTAGISGTVVTDDSDAVPVLASLFTRPKPSAGFATVSVSRLVCVMIPLD